MRALFIVSVLVWLPLCGWAKPRVSSGASAKPAASAVPVGQECMQLALNGRFEGECANDHESDKCVGLSLALRNSLKREECRVRAGEGCLEYSYRQNTQAEWMAVAAGHLAEFGQCVKSQYGSDGSNGFREAMNDPNFRAKMREFEDGGGALGLRHGEILERMLKEESLGSILKSSPAWGSLDGRLRERMMAAADTPAPVTEGMDPQKSEAGSSQKSEAGSWPKGETGSSPTSRMASWNAPVAGKEAAAAHPPEKNTDWNLNASGIEEINRGPASVANDRVFFRQVKANPYSLGLDLSLFDRVSLAYQKKWTGFRGVDDYVKSLPKREPQTVRDLLQRNKEMEL